MISYERMRWYQDKYAVFLLVVILISLNSCLSGNDKIGPYNIDNFEYPDWTWEKEGWKLNIHWIDGKGMHGILWHDEKEVVGNYKFEKINTPLGILVYYGPVTEKQCATGWDFDGRLKY